MDGCSLISGMRCDNNGLIDLIADLPNGIDMVEVGCYSGESTLMFMQSGKVNRLHAVDPWAHQSADVNDPARLSVDQMYRKIKEAEESFLQRIKGHNVVVHKCYFHDAELPKVDFVYIDADHTYESVKNDIRLALRILRPNGIIAGHDYSTDFQGVIDAVNEYKQPSKVYRDTSWIIFKP